MSDDIAEARAQAAHCRQLVKNIADPRAANVLRRMADEYDAIADGLSARKPEPHKP